MNRYILITLLLSIFIALLGAGIIIPVMLSMAGVFLIFSGQCLNHRLQEDRST